MAKRSTISRRQLEMAAEIANKHRVTVRIEVNGSMSVTPVSQEQIDEDDLDSELREFEKTLATHGAQLGAPP